MHNRQLEILLADRRHANPRNYKAPYSWSWHADPVTRISYLPAASAQKKTDRHLDLCLRQCGSPRTSSYLRPSRDVSALPNQGCHKTSCAPLREEWPKET